MVCYKQKKLRAGDTPSTVIVGKGTTKNGTLLLKNLFGKKFLIMRNLLN